jgi:hypothetical protein
MSPGARPVSVAARGGGEFGGGQVLWSRSISGMVGTGGAGRGVEGRGVFVTGRGWGWGWVDAGMIWGFLVRCGCWGRRASGGGDLFLKNTEIGVDGVESICRLSTLNEI